MSVYDTSPQAIAAYIANQQRCHKWAGNTATHANEFKLPFGTRSDFSSTSTKLRLDPDEEDDLEGSLGVPDWERAEMHQLLNAGYPSRPATRDTTERERGRHDHHHHQATERPSTSTLRHHSHGRHRDQHHHHSRSREVVEQLPPPPPPQLKEKKSRSHSRHASSSSRRSRKTSNQTMIYTQPQAGYTYQPVIPPPPPEPKRGFFASIFHRRRSISLPRQAAPPPFLQQPPLQTRLSRSASFHRNRGEVEVHHHSSSSRSKSMERRAAVPPLQPLPQPNAGYWPSRSSPTTAATVPTHYHNSTPSPSSDSSAPLHPAYPSGVAHGQYMYAQPKHQMGYFPPQVVPPQRTVPVMSAHRAPIPSQWHQPPPTLQQMYARPHVSLLLKRSFSNAWLTFGPSILHTHNFDSRSTFKLFTTFF
ncbi:hypothetical protein DL96DRAFT_1586461 [Flagelloscypha sp. PMI_526]|nr:hypothetical protein DL96DRAFT_1586461 [Flagelloscypha sp. PMI_526]